MLLPTAVLATVAVLTASVSAQTFHRAAACPTNGCIYPPDQTEFIAGQGFDLRIEAHKPNGTISAWTGENSITSIQIKAPLASEYVSVESYFTLKTPIVESYNFTFFEDLQARDAKIPTFVAVKAQSYRHIALYTPGVYSVQLTYNGGVKSTIKWEVKSLAAVRAAHNVIVFIGDGMTTSMITAARLLGHKSINGKYQTRMAMDDAPAYGSQMTHSIDSFITDSANSASALATGKKMTVNGLNAYTDSTGGAFKDPKVETVYEMFRRMYNGKVGIVTTAYIADATPAAVVAHTSQRSQYATIISQFLDGVAGQFPWVKWTGVDVLFGGGAEYFLPNAKNNMTDVYKIWSKRNYNIVHDKTSLATLDNKKRALGMFTQGNIATWLDRNVYKSALNLTTAWDGKVGTFDLPSLKDMTIKAIDILNTRAKADGDSGFMLMSEAASIDKQMHILDYDRALGELLEFDDTIRATLQHLKDIGEDGRTLVVVTADHGHGFDVYGSSDSKYMTAQKTDRAKRDAIGNYASSGLSNYQVAEGSLPDNASYVVGDQGLNFPVQWAPRYTIAAGVAAHPDMREDFIGRKDRPRLPADSLPKGNPNSYYANPLDAPSGFLTNGTLPVSAEQGVHSLTDVPVYAWGPGMENFRGVYNSPDIAFKIALALNLGRLTNVTLTV